MTQELTAGSGAGAGRPWAAGADPPPARRPRPRLDAGRREARIRTGRAQLDDVPAPRRGPRPGSYVTLEIAHTGTSLDADALARVFEHPAARRRAGGAVDLSAVALHRRQSGGHVDVESTPGRGHDASRSTSPGSRPDAASPARSRRRSRCGGSETILLVEDDPQVRDVARRALERLGLHRAHRGRRGGRDRGGRPPSRATSTCW